MKNVLFVCTGNTCRSPMAEFILKDILQKRQIFDIAVSSAGTLLLFLFWLPEILRMRLRFLQKPPSKYCCGRFCFARNNRRNYRRKRRDFVYDGKSQKRPAYYEEGKDAWRSCRHAGRFRPVRGKRRDLYVVLSTDKG